LTLQVSSLLSADPKQAGQRILLLEVVDLVLPVRVVQDILNKVATIIESHDPLIEVLQSVLCLLDLLLILRFFKVHETYHRIY
jgi:hypothetical protein